MPNTQQVQKRCVSPRTINRIKSTLPKDPDENRKGFPVTFSEFCAATNVEQISIEAIKKVKPNSYKMYLEYEGCLEAQMYHIYKKFYKCKEARQLSPTRHVSFKDDCPFERRNLIVQFPQRRKQQTTVKTNISKGGTNDEICKFPIGFLEFRKFTNCDEVVAKMLSKSPKVKQGSEQWMCIARNLYLNYYTCLKRREKDGVQVKPCPASMRSKILQFIANNDENANDHNEELATNVREFYRNRDLQTSRNTQQMETCMKAKLQPVDEDVAADTELETSQETIENVTTTRNIQRVHTTEETSNECVAANSQPMEQDIELEAPQEMVNNSPTTENLNHQSTMDANNGNEVAANPQPMEEDLATNIELATQITVPNTPPISHKNLTARKCVQEAATISQQTENNLPASLPQTIENIALEAATNSTTPQESTINESTPVTEPASVIDESIFPVCYDEFLCYTNVKKIARDFLVKNGQVPIDPIEVLILSRKLYREFYTRPRHENRLFDNLFVQFSQLELITSLPKNSKSQNSAYNKSAGVQICDKAIPLNTPKTATNEKVIIQSMEIIRPPDHMSPSALEIEVLPNDFKQMLIRAIQQETMKQQLTAEDQQLVNFMDIPTSADVQCPANNELDEAQTQHTQTMNVDCNEKSNEMTEETDEESNEVAAERSKQLSQQMADEHNKDQHEISPPTAPQLTDDSTWQFPVTFETFCKHTHYQTAVNKILAQQFEAHSHEWLKVANKVNKILAKQFEEHSVEWLKVAYDIYDNFYKSAEKRQEYNIAIKPVPQNMRKKLLEFATKNAQNEISAERSTLTKTGDPYFEVVDSNAAQIALNAKTIAHPTLNNRKRKLYNPNNCENEERSNVEEITVAAIPSAKSTQERVRQYDEMEKNLAEMFCSPLRAKNNENSNETEMTISSGSTDHASSGSSGTIKPYQTPPTDTILQRHNTPTPGTLHDFVDIQTQSLLQPRCESNINTTSNKGTAEILSHTKHTSNATNTQLSTSSTNSEESIIKIKSESQSQPFTPLRDLEFVLDKSSNEFEIIPVKTQPILLEDSLSDEIIDPTSNVVNALLDPQRTLSNIENITLPLSEGDSTLAITEVQRLPSSTEGGIQLNSKVIVPSVRANQQIQTENLRNSIPKATTNNRRVYIPPKATTNKKDQNENVPQLTHVIRPLPENAFMILKKN